MDGERYRIEPRRKISIPYEFERGSREAIRTRFAADTEDGWTIVQNGYIALIPNARILYFMTTDFTTETEGRNRSVRFTYIPDRLRTEEERRRIEEIEYGDIGETEEATNAAD